MDSVVINSEVQVDSALKDLAQQDLIHLEAQVVQARKLTLVDSVQQDLIHLEAQLQA